MKKGIFVNFCAGDCFSVGTVGTVGTTLRFQLVSASRLVPTFLEVGTNLRRSGQSRDKVGTAQASQSIDLIYSVPTVPTVPTSFSVSAFFGVFGGTNGASRPPVFPHWKHRGGL